MNQNAIACCGIIDLCAHRGLIVTAEDSDGVLTVGVRPLKIYADGVRDVDLYREIKERTDAWLEEVCPRDRDVHLQTQAENARLKDEVAFLRDLLGFTLETTEDARISRIDAEIKEANQGIECVYDRVL